MTTIQNTCEGTASGTALTTGNSNTGGDVLANVTGTWLYSSTGAAHGSTGWRCQQGTAAAWRCYFNYTGAATVAARCHLNMNTLATSRTLFTLINGGFTAAARVGVDSSNKLIVQNAAGATLFTSTAAVTATTNYRIELQINVGTTTTDGTINFQYFLGDSTTAVQTYSSGAAVNAGAGSTIIRTQLGNNDSVTIDVTFDDIKTVTGTTTPVGPVGNVAPVAVAGADQTVSAGASVTVAATATDSDGTVSTFTGAWTTLPSGTSAPTLTGSATGTGTASAALSQTATLTDPGIYVWTATATDNASATGTDTLQITVLGTSVYPVTVIDNTGAWTNQGGAADIPSALADASDATYIESVDAPTTSNTITVHVGETLDAGPLIFSIRARTPSGTRHCAAVLLQGTTTIATGPTQTMTTTFTDFPVTLNSTQNGNITDRTNLRIQLIPS